MAKNRKNMANSKIKVTNIEKMKPYKVWKKSIVSF